MGSPLRTFKMFVPDLIASRTSDGKMRIEGVGSSTIRDHHGDSFTQKALRKMADSSLGMTVFMNHGYEVPKDVFGKIEKVRIQKTGITDPRTKQEIWDLRLGIIVASSNPLAVQNFDLIEKDEVGLGISIGAMLPEGGYAPDKEAGGRLLIDDVEPVEYSMVGIPASPRAFVDYAVKSIIGVYPDSRKFAVAWERFKTASAAPAEGDPDITDFTSTDGAETIEPDEPARALDPAEITAGVDTDEVDVITAGLEDVSEIFPEEHFETAKVADDPELVKSLHGLTLDQFMAGTGVATELEKAQWSADYVSKLPDSAFACPKDRAYPHHDANGAVDPAHLRAALSRIGDATNKQCAGGKAHLEAHARKLGIGQAKKALDSSDTAPLQKQDGEHQHPHAHVHDHEHSHGYGDSKVVHDHEHAHQHSHPHDSPHEHRDEFNGWDSSHYHSGANDDDSEQHEHSASKELTPDLAKSHKVTIWEDSDGNRTTEVAIGRKAPKSDDDQSVQDSLSPDTTGGQGDTGGDELIRAAKALVKESNDTAGSVLKAVLGQLEASKARELQMQSERDLAIKVAKQAMEGTRVILERVAMLPVGRKTTDFVAIKEDFGDLSSSLSEIYDEDVRKSMFSKRTP